jgi:hypothetical protein
VGSAAKTASINNIDCRCQTRIAVAARKTGLIDADVAVALSLSLTHKSLGFDRMMPTPDFEAPELQDLPSTNTLPTATDRGARSGGRHRQQPQSRPRRARGSKNTPDNSES